MKKIFISALFVLTGMTLQAQTLEAIMNSAPKFPHAISFALVEPDEAYIKWREECDEYKDLGVAGPSEASVNAAKAQMMKEAKARQKEVNAMKGKSADQIMQQMGGVSMKDIQAMANMTDEERLDYVMMNGLDKSGKAAMEKTRNSQLGKDARNYNNVADAANKRFDVQEEFFALQRKWNARKDSLQKRAMEKWNGTYAPQLRANPKNYEEITAKGLADCWYEPLLEEIGFEQQELKVLFEKANQADRAFAKSSLAQDKLSASQRPLASFVASNYVLISTEIPAFPLGPACDDCSPDPETVKIVSYFSDQNVDLKAPRLRKN